MIVLRSMLAAIVAGILASEAPLTRSQFRAVEYLLFLGLTLLLMFSQYFIGLDLMPRGPDVHADHPGFHQGRRDPDAGADDDLRDAHPERARRSPLGCC